MSGDRGRSTKRQSRRFLDLKCFGPGRNAIGGITAPAHGLLLRRPDGDLDERVHDPRRGGPLAGIFFSKAGGAYEVLRLRRERIITGVQASYALRAIGRSQLPKRDTLQVQAFYRLFAERALTSVFDDDDETLGLGSAVVTQDGHLIPFDVFLMRVAVGLPPTG